jgi:hypothetical protein
MEMLINSSKTSFLSFRLLACCHGVHVEFVSLDRFFLSFQETLPPCYFQKYEVKLGVTVNTRIVSIKIPQPALSDPACPNLGVGTNRKNYQLCDNRIYSIYTTPTGLVRQLGSAIINASHNE